MEKLWSSLAAALLVSGWLTVHAVADETLYLQSEPALGTATGDFRLQSDTALIRHELSIPLEITVLDELTESDDLGFRIRTRSLKVHIPAMEFSFQTRLTDNFVTHFYEVTAALEAIDLEWEEIGRKQVFQNNGEIGVQSIATVQETFLSNLVWSIAEVGEGEVGGGNIPLSNTIGDSILQSHTLTDVQLPHSAILDDVEFNLPIGNIVNPNLVIANQLFDRALFSIHTPTGFEPAPMAALVPEPSSSVIAALGLAFSVLLVQRSRRQAKF